MSSIRPHSAAGIAHGMPRSTGTGATVSRACGRQRNEAGPITRRFRSAVSGEQEKKQFRGSLRVRGSASGQAQQPIQSEFGWETGGRPQRPKSPIQNAFGWGMGLDGDGWACPGAVTMSSSVPVTACIPLSSGWSHRKRHVGIAGGGSHGCSNAQ